MQEAYASQVRWLASRALPPDEWGVIATGRNRRRTGESVPLWHRTDTLRPIVDRTRWFGPTPDQAGSRFPGTRTPRISTVVEYARVADDARVVVANLHLDTSSVVNRADSLAQLAEWIGAPASGRSVIVLGDFNAELGERGFAALTGLGLRSALPVEAGPTSNGFGRGGDASRRQIDHVFVSEDLTVARAEICAEAGYASDHYPVVVDLAF